MNVIRKDFAIENVGADDEMPGSFQVVLSTPAKDRDGDELATEDWKQPLPEHITFDVDHGMSVEKTVGSGRPYIDDQGRLLVDGTYASLQKAQDVRTLVNEKHIRTVSVAFMSEKETKGGKTRTVRELLNGAFVAIPSNREAVILGSKSIDAKAGARNSSADQKHIQAAHDELVAAGADCGPEDDSGAAEGATGGKSYRVYVKGKYTAEQLRELGAQGHAFKNDDGTFSYPIDDLADLDNAIHAVGRGNADHDKIRAYIIGRAKALDASDKIPDNWNSDGSITEAAKALRRMVAAKAVDGSYEQREQAIYDALQALYPSDDMWAYTLATFDDTVIFRVSGAAAPQLQGSWQATYTYDNGIVTLGTPEKVNLVEQVIPLKSYKITKAPAAVTDPAQLAQAVDAALDEGWNLLDGLDQTGLPEPVQQALGCFAAAGATVDTLLDAMNVTNPDDSQETTPDGDEQKSLDADALAMKAAAINATALALT